MSQHGYARWMTHADQITKTHSASQLRHIRPDLAPPRNTGADARDDQLYHLISDMGGLPYITFHVLEYVRDSLAHNLA